MFAPLKKLQDGTMYAKNTSNDNMILLKNVRIEGTFDESENVTLVICDSTLINSADASVCSYAKANSTEWFGKDLSEKTLNAAFTQSVRDDSMIVQKASKRGSSVVRVFNHDKTTSSTDQLTDGILCDVYVEMSGVQFFKRTYGIVWKIVQVRLKPTPKPKRNRYTDECLFQEEEEEEDNESDEDDM